MTSYEQAVTQRDRVLELDRQIREANPAMKLDVLRPAVEELLRLQPQREDIQRLKEKIEQLSPAPPSPLVMNSAVVTRWRLSFLRCCHFWGLHECAKMDPLTSTGGGH